MSSVVPEARDNNVVPERATTTSCRRRATTTPQSLLIRSRTARGRATPGADPARARHGRGPARFMGGMSTERRWTSACQWRLLRMLSPSGRGS
jgi:hypothetical protein